MVRITSYQQIGVNKTLMNPLEYRVQLHDRAKVCKNHPKTLDLLLVIRKKIIFNMFGRIPKQVFNQKLKIFAKTWLRLPLKSNHLAPHKLRLPQQTCHNGSAFKRLHHLKRSHKSPIPKQIAYHLVLFGHDNYLGSDICFFKTPLQLIYQTFDIPNPNRRALRKHLKQRNLLFSLKARIHIWHNTHPPNILL